MAAVLTAPNGITLFRLVLFGVFIWLALQARLSAAMLVFAVAWGLDVLDGYIARRWHQATAFGFVFDKVVDRLILVGGGVVLIATGYLAPLIGLLFIKDIICFPAMLWEVARRQKVSDLGMAGKIFALLQGLALLWLVLVGTYSLVITIPLSITGVIIGAQYWQRVRRQ